MKRVEFKPPKGFMVPEGVSNGGTFEQLCTFKMKGNGDICLIAMGDTAMPGYGDKQGPEPDPINEIGASYAGRMREHMNGGGY